MQKCCVCGKPVVTNHPNAQVSHMVCAMRETKPQRDKQQGKGHKPMNKFMKGK